MVDSKEKMKKKIGKKFYSPYFKQMIEVVKYVDDNNWTFKLENGEVYAAKTPLSYFKEHDFTIDNPKRAVKQDMSKGQFVDGTDKTNDKIEEIVKECDEGNIKDKVLLSDVGIDVVVNKISTLIQEERKEAYNEGYEEGKLLDTKVYVGIEPMKKIQEEAVEGFAEWLNAHDFLFRDGLMMKMYEQYLSQQREKGTK